MVSHPVSTGHQGGFSGRRWVQLPGYEPRVWLKWIALTALVVVPAGALLGFLMPVLEYAVFPRLEPPPADWDAPGELAKAVPVGIWLVIVPWTAIYFEGVNARYRAVDGGRGSSRTPGFGLAVTALVLATFFLAPVAILVGAVAWWRISAVGTRYARGSATVATATVGAIVAAAIVAVLAGWSSWSSTGNPGAPRSAATTSSAAVKQIAIRDLTIAVPADWQLLDAEAEDTTAMADPAGAVGLMCTHMEATPGMTAVAQGRSLAAILRADKDFSAVQERPLVLPSGIPGYEIRYHLDSDGESVAGTQYTLIAGPPARRRLYLVTYQADGSSEGTAEVRASVRSIRKRG